MKRDRPIQVNEGIVGAVTADTLAVGTGAQATKIIHGSPARDAVETELAELRRALASLQLPAVSHEALKEDVGQLEAALKVPNPEKERVGGILTNLTGKLKMVGVVLSEGVALGESIRRIAQLVRVPLNLLGIGW